jgi:hypothetical protein
MIPSRHLCVEKSTTSRKECLPDDGQGIIKWGVVYLGVIMVRSGASIRVAGLKEPIARELHVLHRHPPYISVFH